MYSRARAADSMCVEYNRRGDGSVSVACNSYVKQLQPKVTAPYNAATLFYISFVFFPSTVSRSAFQI